MSGSKIKLATTHDCTGCMACVDSCRHDALHAVIRRDGHYYVEIDREKCIGCGACMKACPVVSGFAYGNNFKSESKPFAAWCTDEDLIRRSSSGGVFAALATRVLAAGGVVVGAAMESSVARHIAIETIDDLYKLQGSKYQQSATQGIYSKTLEYLKSGRTVLFSGLGCQVAALYSFLGNRKFDNLITVDLICGGVPSRKIIEKFLSLTGYDNITAYRDKIDGWFDGKGYALSVEEDSSTKRIPLKESFVLTAFCGGATQRYSCMDCRFNGTARRADMTIGDFWGVKEFEEQHFNGISLVIVHSDKGRVLLEESALELRDTDWNKALAHNPRIAIGKVLFTRYSLRRVFVGYWFDHLSFKNLEILYSNRKGGVLWLPYRAVRYVLWRLQMRYSRRHVERILSSFKDR